LQFDLNRDIDGADVQAAINAARSYLRANLPDSPTYEKVNPAYQAIFVMILTSKIYDRGRLNDAASNDHAAKNCPRFRVWGKYLSAGVLFQQFVSMGSAFKT
jgi:multidrug efflux pump